METSMLDFFDYNITSPTGYQFLVRILKIARMAPKSKCAFRASYFAERCLQEHDMLVYRPSLVAAAAAYLALKQERPEPWVSACLPPYLPASLLLSPRLPPKALRVTPAYCFHGRASHSHSAPPHVRTVGGAPAIHRLQSGPASSRGPRHHAVREQEPHGSLATPPASSAEEVRAPQVPCGVGGHPSHALSSPRSSTIHDPRCRGCESSAATKHRSPTSQRTDSCHLVRARTSPLSSQARKARL